MTDPQHDLERVARAIWPDRDFSRCSLCGAIRIISQERPLGFGVCTLLGCREPSYDLKLEERILAVLRQFDPLLGCGHAERPQVVCLCGSTRFSEAFRSAMLSETLAGKIVLTVGCMTHSDKGLCITPEQKVALDELHKRKIDLADEVLVLNVGGYIGESTHSEINYADAHGKPVRYLETR